MLLAIIKVLHDLCTTENNVKFDNISWLIAVISLLISILEISLCYGSSTLNWQ